MRITLPTTDWCIEPSPSWYDQVGKLRYKYYVRHLHENPHADYQMSIYCMYKDTVPYKCAVCGAPVPEEVVGFRTLAQWSLDGSVE